MVEDILRPIYQERASQVNTSWGIMMIEKREKSISITDTFDAILLIVVKEADQPVFIKHYSYKDKKAAMHIVTEAQMNEWLLLGSNRKFVEWIDSGKLLFDRNEFITSLKTTVTGISFRKTKIKHGFRICQTYSSLYGWKSFF